MVFSLFLVFSLRITIYKRVNLHKSASGKHGNTAQVIDLLSTNRSSGGEEGQLYGEVEKGKD